MNCIEFLRTTYCETPAPVLDPTLVSALNILWTFATWFIPVIVGLACVAIIYGKLTLHKE